MWGVSELGLPIAHVARLLGVPPPVDRTGLLRGANLLSASGLSAPALVAGKQGQVS
jgi:hypothetical protein